MAKTRSHLTSSQRARVRRAAGLPPSARKTPTNPARDSGRKGYTKSIRPTIAEHTRRLDPSSSQAGWSGRWGSDHDKPIGSRFVTTRTEHPKSGRTVTGRGRLIKVGWGKPKLVKSRTHVPSSLSREQRTSLRRAKKATLPRSVLKPLREVSTRFERAVSNKEISQARKKATTSYRKLRSSYGL